MSQSWSISSTYIHWVVLCVQAVKLIEDVHLRNEEEEEVWKQALIKLYLNLSLCLLRLKKAERAAALCRKALDLDENSVKAHYRLGQVLEYAAILDSTPQHINRCITDAVMSTDNQSPHANDCLSTVSSRFLVPIALCTWSRGQSIWNIAFALWHQSTMEAHASTVPLIYSHDQGRAQISIRSRNPESTVNFYASELCASPKRIRVWTEDVLEWLSECCIFLRLTCFWASLTGQGLTCWRQRDLLQATQRSEKNYRDWRGELFFAFTHAHRFFICFNAWLLGGYVAKYCGLFKPNLGRCWENPL